MRQQIIRHIFDNFWVSLLEMLIKENQCALSYRITKKTKGRNQFFMDFTDRGYLQKLVDDVCNTGRVFVNFPVF